MMTATYNDLPTELTANIFSYLRHERRQPPHAYCIDKLIEYTHDLLDPYDGLTEDGEMVWESIDARGTREFLGNHVGRAVFTSFFIPYVEAMGFDEDTYQIEDYREPQYLSWTYAIGGTNKKYDRYDKNGILNMMP